MGSILDPDLDDLDEVRVAIFTIEKQSSIYNPRIRYLTL